MDNVIIKDAGNKTAPCCANRCPVAYQGNWMSSCGSLIPRPVQRGLGMRLTTACANRECSVISSRLWYRVAQLATTFGLRMALCCARGVLMHTMVRLHNWYSLDYGAELHNWLMVSGDCPDAYHSNGMSGCTTGDA